MRALLLPCVNRSCVEWPPNAWTCPRLRLHCSFALLTKPLSHVQACGRRLRFKVAFFLGSWVRITFLIFQPPDSTQCHFGTNLHIVAGVSGWVNAAYVHFLFAMKGESESQCHSHNDVTQCMCSRQVKKSQNAFTSTWPHQALWVPAKKKQHIPVWWEQNK